MRYWNLGIKKLLAVYVLAHQESVVLFSKMVPCELVQGSLLSVSLVFLMLIFLLTFHLLVWHALLATKMGNRTNHDFHGHQKVRDFRDRRWLLWMMKWLIWNHYLKLLNCVLDIRFFTRAKWDLCYERTISEITWIQNSFRL